MYFKTLYANLIFAQKQKFSPFFLLVTDLSFIVFFLRQDSNKFYFRLNNKFKFLILQETITSPLHLLHLNKTMRFPVLFVVLFIASLVHGDIFNVVTKDSYLLSKGILGSDLTQKFGNEVSVTIGNYYTGVVYAGMYEGLYELNLTIPIPAGKTVGSANLVLFVVGGNTNQPAFSINQTAALWNESTVSYATAPSNLGVIDTVAASTSADLTIIPLTSFVQNHLNSIVSIRITPTNSKYVVVHSNQAAYAVLKPVLDVTFVQQKKRGMYHPF